MRRIDRLAVLLMAAAGLCLPGPKIAGAGVVSLVQTAERIWSWDLAPRPGGGFSVVWVEAPAGAQSGASIYLRRFAASGAAEGDAITVVVPEGIPEVALAVDASGNELVAFRQALGQTVERWELRVVARAPNGSELWPGALVAEVSDAFHFLGGFDVVAAPGGGWLVAWEQYAPQGSPQFHLHARPVALADGALGPRATIDEGAAESLDGLRLASDGTSLLASWRSRPPSGNTMRLLARELGADGTPGAAVRELVTLSGTELNLGGLSLDAGSGGRYLLSWAESSSESEVRVRATYFAPLAPAPAPVELLRHGGYAGALGSSVGVDRSGRALVAWPESPVGAAYPTVIYRRGQLVSGSAITEVVAPGYVSGVTGPAVSVSDAGDWVVAWDRSLVPGIPFSTGIDAEVGTFHDGCETTPEVLCLLGSRFLAGISYRDHLGGEGPGRAFPLTPESGTFWFFSPDNVEVMVKVVDACAHPDFNDFWVYAAGMTDVATTLTVIDTWTGEVWERDTTLGEPFPPLLDSQAFHTCGASPLAAP